MIIDLQFYLKRLRVKCFPGNFLNISWHLFCKTPVISYFQTISISVVATILHIKRFQEATWSFISQQQCNGRISHAAFLKENFITSVFMWVLQKIFSESFFYRARLGDYFRFSFWQCWDDTYFGHLNFYFFSAKRPPCWELSYNRALRWSPLFHWCLWAASTETSLKYTYISDLDLRIYQKSRQFLSGKPLIKRFKLYLCN